MAGSQGRWRRKRSEAAADQQDEAEQGLAAVEAVVVAEPEDPEGRGKPIPKRAAEMTPEDGPEDLEHAEPEAATVRPMRMCLAARSGAGTR